MNSISKVTGTTVIILLSVVLIIWMFYPDEMQSSPQYDHPNLAQLHEFNMTKDPSLGYPPVDRLNKGRAYQSAYFNQARAIQDVNWMERGPNNIGGRTRAIMFDPNDPMAAKVWAAGVTGGLWYNNNIVSEGTPWQKVDDFNGTLAVNNIVYDPNATETFYFGTGEGWFGQGMIRGNGIWKSMDGGDTWAVLNSTDGNTDFSFVQKVVVTRASTILAATRNTSGSGGIYRSNNGGASWVKELNGLGADIEVAGDTIYASLGIGSPGKIFRSTNDGIDWTDITPASGGERIEIGVSEGSHEIVYAVASDGDGNVPWFYRSDDAGETWVQLAIPKYLNQGSCTASSDDFARQQAWYDLVIGVHPTNAQLVMVGGIDLHRSEDGGATWEPISYWASDCETQVHADQHNMIFRPGYPNQALFTNDGGVYYSKNVTTSKTDGGPVIEMRNKDYNVTQFYSCALINEVGTHYFLAGAQDNGTHQFGNVGLNTTFEITGGDGGFCFIDQDNPDIQITSYVQNNYFVTNNFWNSVKEVGSDEKGLFINPTDYNSESNTLYAAGNDGNLLRYKNIQNINSISEEEFNLSIDQISAITISTYDPDTIFVGTVTGNIYLVKSSQTGSPIAISITNNLNSGYISNIAMGSSNSHLLVTSTSYGVASVWETINGGDTWSSKEGNLPDMPIRWALYNPNNFEEVMLATDLGIWSTDQLSDNPPEWEPTNTGLANVRCDMIKCREADGLIVVATHGRGLFTSDIFSDTSYAEFYIPDLVAYVDQPVRFKDASVKPVSYSWEFGDGNSSSDANPTNTYTSPGSYEVRLTINNSPLTSYTVTLDVLPALTTDYLLANGGNFESNSTDFRAITLAGSGFMLGSSNIPNKSGTHSGQNAWVLAPDDSEYEPYSEAYLYTPSFDFSFSGAYSLEFFTKYKIEDEWDGFILQYSIDAGRTWEKLGDFQDTENWYNQIAIGQNGIFPPGKPFFSGTTTGFVKKSLDLSFLSSTPTVAFRFMFKSDPAAQEAGVVIDDFQLLGPDMTAPDVSFNVDQASICEQESTIIQNESTGAILGYQWDFGDGAEPQVASGYGPYEVTYSNQGTKLITLTATTAGDDIVITREIEVIKKAAVVNMFHGLSTACEDDALEITIEDSESGINYVLMEGETVISDTVQGDGSDLLLNSDGLSAGDKSLQVKAFASGECIIEIPLEELTVFSNPIGVVTKVDDELTTTFNNGDSYQWYLDGQPLNGADQPSLVPELTGAYTLEITINGCSGISEPFDYAPLQVSRIDESIVFPNPTNSIANVKMHISGNYAYQVLDIAGRILMNGMVSHQKEFAIDLSDNRAGIYYIRIISDQDSLMRKVIKR